MSKDVVRVCLLAIALPLLLGAHDTADPLPTRAYIIGVTVHAMPMTRPDGTGWDAFSGPDLFVTFSDTQGNLLFRSSTADDLTPADFPVDFQGNLIQITDLNRTYQLDLWDEDITTNEFIGTAGRLTAEDHRGSASVSLSSDTIQTTIYLRWE